MFDCHIHMVLDGVNWRESIARHKAAPQEALIRKTLAQYQALGYTYLRDGGDRWGAGALAAKLAPEYGIRYRTPCFPIYKTGHYGSFIGRGFSTPAEYRALVRAAKAAGAHFIKIMISGLMDFEHYGVLTDEPLAPGEIADMIAGAHDEGFSVMAHANGDSAVRAALAAGVDSIEHGAYLSPETRSQLAESHAVWVPTLVTIGNLIGDGRFPDAALRPLLAFQQRSVRDAAAQGARIACGSDAGAYRVLHAQGGLDEQALLRRTLGPTADQILTQGNYRDPKALLTPPCVAPKGSPSRGAFLGGGTPALHIKQAARTSGCLLVLYRSSLYLPESKSDSVRVRRRLMASVRVCVSSGKRPEAMAVRIGRISYCAPSAPEPRSMRYSGV